MSKKNKNPFESSSIKVPFFSPYISNDDKRVVKHSLNSTLLTDGPKLKKFEDVFAKYTGAKYAIGVSNATAALHLSLKAIGVKKDDEVIIPDMTFVATASSVLLSGAKPIFADIDKDDLGISIESLKNSITSKTKAIIPVHFAGKASKIEKIVKIAKEKKIFIIEDCAHAIGTRVRKKHVG